MALFSHWSNQVSSKLTKPGALLVIVISAALALGSFSLHAKTEPLSDDDLGLKEYTTPAGHKFWYFPMPNADRTALFIDWAQEVPLGEGTHPGVAELGIELMLKGGAGDRDAAQIVADYGDLDAGSGLWVRPRGASGYFVAPDKHFSQAREIAQQVLTKPRFEQKWFDREHQIMIESAVEDRASSWGLAWTLARTVFLGDHPYNKFWSYNSLDEFEKVSLDDVKAWYESSFSTNTTTLAVAGSAAVDTIAKEIDLLLAGLPTHKPVKPIDLPKPRTTGKTILLHNPDAPKSVLLLAGSFPSNNEDINTTLQVGLAVFGRGKNSRLFKTVRSGMGASYGFGADVHDVTQEYRMLAMSGEVETGQLQEALNGIEQAYAEFRQSGISPEEFPVFKQFYKREVKKQLAEPANVAYHLNKGVRDGFSADYMNTTMVRIDSLERSSTNKLITESFPAYDKLLKLIVSPDKKAVEGACVISTIAEAESCL